ncbi:MAG TPA: LamG-like jellyroll fold domain-containing protein [Thermoguttaceae bacterium]|nr:LamG-like jellyroll fold domain-containing protein [Thermoguttaceae bacterium]
MHSRNHKGLWLAASRRRIVLSGVVTAAVGLLLASAPSARADLATNLQLYSSMNAITPYQAPAYWEDATTNDHVSLVNTPAYDGGTGRTTAIDFVGDNGANRIFVNDGSNVDLDPGTTDYSVSLWYNETTAEAYNYLLIKGNSYGSTQGGYSLGSVNGVPTLRMNDALEAEGTKISIPSAGGATTTGAWHHLVAVFDRTGTVHGTANQVLFFVDNNLQGSAFLDTGDPLFPYNVSCPNPLYQPVCIGGRNHTTANDFEGYMDDVAVYRGALSATDINTLNTATSLDAGTITTSGITPVMIHNFVDNRNVAEVKAMAPDDWDGKPGTIWYENVGQATDPTRGQVLQLDGAQFGLVENVRYGDVLDPMSTSYTAQIWVKLTDHGYGQVIMGKGMNQSTASEGWTAYYEATTGLLQIRANHDGTTTGRLGVSKAMTLDDQWHHIALVIDQENGLLKGYFDGLGSGATGTENGWAIGFGNTFTPGVEIDAVDELTIGFHNTNRFPINGLVDDFAIWNRALTDAEILGLFNGAAFPTPSDIPGDASGNGSVGAEDATILSQYWGVSGPEIGWDQGDFNGDNAVNALDASILAANWGAGAGEASGVPEPSTLVLLLGLPLMLLVRRR